MCYHDYIIIHLFLHFNSYYYLIINFREKYYYV